MLLSTEQMSVRSFNMTSSLLICIRNIDDSTKKKNRGFDGRLPDCNKMSLAALLSAVIPAR